MSVFKTGRIISILYKTIFCIVLSFLYVTQSANAQFSKEWDRFYGGSSYEELKILHELPDGYLVFGNVSYSLTGDPPITYGSGDFWMYKIDFDGNILWQHVFGGNLADVLQDVQPTADGGFILGGFSYSDISGVKTSANRGDPDTRDMWIIKITADGTIEWDQTYGGDGEDYLSTLKQTADGGYILGGWTNSTVSGEVSEPTRGDPYDYWAVRIDASGNLLWDKRYGGNSGDLMQEVIQTDDGGFLFGGQSRSDISGEKSEDSFGTQGKIDYWLVKADANGNKLWDRTFGGIDSEEVRSMVQAEDGSYFIGGYSSSAANGNKTANSRGGRDYWLVKMDANGNKLWDKAYGGFDRDEIRKLRVINKENVALMGFSRSSISGDKTELSRGQYDYWMVVINQAGNIQYQKTLGGSENDIMFDVLQSPDGDFLIGGFTLSDTSGDITDTKKGIQDNWIVKLSCNMYIDLGQDTLVCQYEPIFLDPNNSSVNPCEYRWSTGATSPTITVNPDRDTSFAVTVTDFYGCVKRDTIFVTTKEVPEFELGLDYAICIGDSTQLSIGTITPETISWSTGSDSPAIMVNNPDNYSVTLTNSNACTFTDDINIASNALPSFSLGGNQFICPDESLALVISHPGPFFNWSSTVATSQAITVSNEGTYSVTVTDNNGCVLADSMELRYYDLPIIDLGSDTTLCASDTYTLDATASNCPSCSYLWNDAVTNPIRVVQSDFQQTYQVTVTDGNDCTVSDAITIDINTNPTINLGLDQSICVGDSTFIPFQLTGNAPFTIVYTDGFENDTLTNISNGMGIWVAPITTTTYSILSVEDNASPNTCSSIILDSNTITVYNQEETQLFIEICVGESHFAQGADQFATGIYIDTLQTINACDSVVFTNLTVNPLDTTTLMFTSCLIEEAGIDTLILTNQYSCDSLVIQITELLPSDTIYRTAESCNVFEEGLDTLYLANQFGCDSLIITNTILLPNDDIEIYETTCDITQEGVVWNLLENEYGCDSLVVTVTTFIPPDFTYFSFGNCDPSTVGLDTVYLQNQYTCDSLVITETFLFPTDTTYLLSESCDLINVGQDSLLTQNQFGCDSLVVTTTTLLPSDTIYLTEETCQQDVLLHEENLFTNQFGCDSLVVIDRTVFPLDTTILEMFTCIESGASIDSITIANQFGCDSLVVTNTVYVEADTTRLEAFTCDEDAVGVETDLYNTLLCDSIVITTTLLMADDTLYLSASSCNPLDTGIFTTAFINQMGCDSVIIETVDLLQKDTIVNQLGSCDPIDVGVDTLVLTNQYGCDSLIIDITSLYPTDTIYQTFESCFPSDTGTIRLFLTNQYSCDSLVIQETLLLPSDTTYLMATSCDTMDIGMDTLGLNNEYNCDSLVITTTTLLPSNTIFITEETCDQNALVYEELLFTNQYGCDSLIVYDRIIHPLDTVYLEDLSCDINQEGIDSLTFMNQYGCDSLVITNTTFVEADSTYIEVFTCDQSILGTVTEVFSTDLCDSLVFTTTLLLQIDTTYIQSFACDLADTGVFEYTLSTTMGCDSIVVDTVLFTESQDLYFTAQVCSVLDTGLVTTNYTNQFGCDSIVSIQSNLATDTIYMYETTCDYLDNYETLSSYINEAGCDSTIITVTTLLETSIVSSTEYTCDPSEIDSDTLFFTNAVGCDSLVIDNIALFELEINLQIDDESCFGENDGNLIIEGISGGQEPYLVSLDGAPFSNLFLFRDLSNGSHIVSIEDSNGCEETLSFEILAADPFEVDLGEDVTLNFGETGTLTIDCNQPIFNQVWSDTTNMDCIDCLSTTVIPFNSTNYQVTVTNEADCVATDDVWFIVKRDRSIFIPSAFSPNGDNLNDTFIPYAGLSVKAVRSVMVMDRWGNIVFSDTSNNILDSKEGWDGTFNGKALGSAVFVYLIEVEYIDGIIETISGDVTLMR